MIACPPSITHVLPGECHEKFSATIRNNEEPRGCTCSCTGNYLHTFFSLIPNQSAGSGEKNVCCRSGRGARSQAAAGAVPAGANARPLRRTHRARTKDGRKAGGGMPVSGRHLLAA